MTNLPKILSAISLIAFLTTLGSMFIAVKLVDNRLDQAKVESKQENNSQLVQKFLTASEVATHSTAADCWLVIDQKVYNLTQFLASHPGGSIVITPYCGRDATKAYHSKDRSPAVSHSQVADQLLPNYLLGHLASKQILPTPMPSLTPIIIQKTTNSQVSVHNTTADCWLTISGQVYAVSAYLAVHPGGAAVIAPYCGKDATSAFASKGKNPGVSHSAYAQSLLANYLVSGTKTRIVSPTPVIFPTSAPIANTSLTTSGVASHSTAWDCWSIINNNVYNLTNYLVQHPGGVSAITPYCGKDGTYAFNSRGGSGSHSNTAKSLLNNFLIGTLGSSTTINNSPGSAVPTSTSTPLGNCSDLPSFICSKYPGAVKLSGKYEDNGSWEGKISISNGFCRAIKINSSGSIIEDKNC